MHYPNSILPDFEIEELVKKKVISASSPIGPLQIQPASLDLRLGQIAYRIKASFLPGEHSSVEEKLARFKLHSLDLSKGAVLETNCVYIAPLQESLALPYELAALGNPKSSTGRLDIFTRLISDYATKFDVVKKGYKGPLYLEISPQTFPIIIHEGSKLFQLRLQKDRAKAIEAKEINLSVNLLGFENNIIGYRAKKHTDVIDVDKIAHYAKTDFWEPIYRTNEAELILDPKQFYILASDENVCIEHDVAAEMVAIDPLVGEFRVHYAGFFDPGFGSDKKSRAVLEVRSYDIAFILEHKQIIGKLKFYPMSAPPHKLYGIDKKSNYQAQQLKLSKHFID